LAGIERKSPDLQVFTSPGPSSKGLRADFSPHLLTARGPIHKSPLLSLGDVECQPKSTSKERSEMAFTPLHDRVLVRRVESDDKTKGGLIIPDTAKEKPAEGEVVACGDGARKDSGELIAMAVKAGDKILFGKWSGTEVNLEGEELLIMKESDILGVIA